MKLKNVLLTLGLALGVSAGVRAAIAGNILSKGESKPIQVFADEKGTYYFRGKFQGVDHWNDGADYPIQNNGEPWIVSLNQGDEFKVVPYASSWTGEITTAQGDAIGNGITASGGSSNIYVNEANTYTFWMIDGSLYIDFGVYHYSGDDNSFGITPDANHPDITVNGEAVTWSLDKNEQFKIRNNNWSKGVFGYDQLVDGDFYGSFARWNGGNGDNNIIAEITGSYDASMSIETRGEWNLRIVPHGVDPDDTAFVYILDKYGNLIHDSHRAFTWIDGGQAMTFPGSWMATYSGTNHMYQLEFWTGMEKVLFNSHDEYGYNGVQTWDWDISANGQYSNRGKCLILDGTKDEYDKWSSNVWVEPETAKFIENCMHFANYNEQQQGDGYCVSAGWYTTAVKAYEALDEKYQKEICSLPDVLERLQKWAIANEEHFVVTDGVGVFGSSVTPVLGFLNNSGNNATAMIVVTVTFVSMVGVAGFFFIRRRKEQ